MSKEPLSTGVSASLASQERGVKCGVSICAEGGSGVTTVERITLDRDTASPPALADVFNVNEGPLNLSLPRVINLNFPNSLTRNIT